MKRLLVVGAVAAAVWAGPVAGAYGAVQPAWAALEIGPLFPRCNFDNDICDDDISSYDINAQGWVVGDAFPDVHWAWIWKSDGAMGVLGDGTGPYDEAGALAENSTGDTTGYMYSSSDFDIPTHAFRLKNGVWTDLPTLAGGFATGYGITDTDVLVGASTTASGARHAVRWPSTGQITDLGTLGGVDSQANAVNSTGQIVGWAETASGHQHAFVFQSGRIDRPRYARWPGKRRELDQRIRADRRLGRDSRRSPPRLPVFGRPHDRPRQPRPHHDVERGVRHHERWRCRRHGHTPEFRAVRVSLPRRSDDRPLPTHDHVLRRHRRATEQESSDRPVRPRRRMVRPRS